LNRRDELVGLLALVSVSGRGLPRVGVMLGNAVDEEVVGALDPVPAAVAVHRPVASDDRSDAPGPGRGHPLLDCRQEPGSGPGEGVAPVGERVQHEVRYVQLSP
jgi:hypothetical protein